MTKAEIKAEKEMYPHWFSHDENDGTIKVVKKVFKTRTITTAKETIEHVQAYVKEHRNSSTYINNLINELNEPKRVQSAV